VNLKVVLAIAANHLERMFRQKAALFWVFVGPVLFVTFFGLVFRENAPAVPSVDVWNRDADDRVARAIAVALQGDKIQAQVVREADKNRFTLEVPAGTAQALASGKGMALVLQSPEDEQTNRERRLSFRTTKALLQVYLQANPADLPAAPTDDDLRARIDASLALHVVRGELGVERRNITAGFQRSVPAYLIMFVFMNLLVSGANIAEERAGGQLRRLFMAPVRRGDIVGGMLLGRVALGVLQAAYMLALGVLVFKIHWAEHPWVLLAFLTLFAIASAALGMLVGTIFRDPDKCEAAAVWTGILVAPLGGLWWPLEVVGPTMKQIGHAVPTGWGMEAVNGMLAFGDGALEVAPYAAALLVMSVVCLYVVVRRLEPT